jgi:hypothetical protein
MKTDLKSLWSAPVGIVILGLLLYWPAGTLNYWQAWVFIAVFTLATVLPTIYLARTGPAALQRRVRGGPWAETRTVQKFVIIGGFSGLFAIDDNAAAGGGRGRVHGASVAASSDARRQQRAGSGHAGLSFGDGADLSSTVNLRIGFRRAFGSR